MHFMNNRFSRKLGFMALKLDMSKTYGWVEWSFLRAIMSKMEFNQKWIYLIMQCVESISYSILINSAPNRPFKPSRGIRQSDPLSPYLLILLAEALISMLNEVENSGAIIGIPIAIWMILINDLFFANDIFLFCKANSLEWSRLISLLQYYEKAYR